MRLFVDTEFTDLFHTDLLSIGIASDDGRTFYAECSEFDDKKLSEFTRLAVLPLLGKDPAAICGIEELQRRLQTWMQQFRDLELVVVSYDFAYDWEFFSICMDGEFSSNLRHQNIGKDIDKGRQEEFWSLYPERRRHHSLDDALALRYAFTGF